MFLKYVEAAAIIKNIRNWQKGIFSTLKDGNVYNSFTLNSVELSVPLI